MSKQSQTTDCPDCYGTGIGLGAHGLPSGGTRCAACGGSKRVPVTTLATLPICPVCGEEIESDDCTEEGGALFHFVCCPPDEETLADE